MLDNDSQATQGTERYTGYTKMKNATQDNANKTIHR